MIKFDNVTKIFKNHSTTNALKNVSFEIEKGEFVSIIGRSGSGKTTMIRLLLGEEKPDKGNVIFKGENVNRMKKSEIQNLRRKMGVVYQDYRLLQHKTVFENIEYIMQVIGAKEKDIIRDIPQILDIVGLESKIDNFPKELSGGEKQRLAIARALCHRPEVILADEPTGNLDIYNTFEIVKLLKKIHRLGTTICIATHDKEIVDNIEERVILLEDGELMQDKKQGKFIL